MGCDEILKKTKQKNVLRVSLDNKLKFATHSLYHTKTANKKFNALTRTQKYMTTDRKKLIFPSVIKLQFLYCPLTWVFCTKHSLLWVNNIHERCQRLIQQNYISEFKRLLENANEKLVHKKCIEFLLIEIYKYLNSLSPDIMNTIFKLNKIPITSETATHLNLKILEQRSST